MTREVPTPYPSTGAAASAAIEYSSRSPLSTILVSRAPSSSSSVADLPGHHRRGRRCRCGPRRARARPAPPRCAPRGATSKVSTSRVVPLPSAAQLGGEGVPLAVVHQGERVRAGAAGRDAVVPAGLQVGGGREAGDVGGPGAGHGGHLVGAARAHLDDRPPVRRVHHPGRGRGDRRVMVEDRQHEGLQHDRLGERRLHHQDRRAGEVAVAFAVAPDVPAEAVGLQVTQGAFVHHVVIAQERELVRPEAELLQGVEQPAGPGDHAVPAAVREGPGEHLEDGAPPRRAAAQRGGQHGELVTVGQQRRAGPAGNSRHEQEDYGGPGRCTPPGCDTRRRCVRR